MLLLYMLPGRSVWPLGLKPGNSQKLSVTSAKQKLLSAIHILEYVRVFYMGCRYMCLYSKCTATAVSQVQ